jgi:VCBS repeat-containing protein
MPNLTITNLDLSNVVLKDPKYRDETLNLSGAQTVSEGQLLARDSVSLKLVNFVPGGAALKSTNDGPFNLDPADTIVIDVNDVGNATCTWDAASATITDTTTYPVADQDTKTMTITITGGEYDAVVQTVTFNVATTTAALVASGINAQAKGVQAAVVGGQVKLTTDGAGSGFDIATGAGTGDLTWGSSTAGTGDAADINAVTATEVKTVIEADSTATVTVSGDAAVIKATTELDFISGLALTKLGLSVETITANENGIPKALLSYELAGANGDNAVRALVGGEVRDDKLVIADGSSVTNTIRDQLRDYGIIPVAVDELNIQDNQ